MRRQLCRLSATPQIPADITQERLTSTSSHRKMKFSLVWCLAASVCLLLRAGPAQGHGRLENPPGRATMWRHGYQSPPDYNDNQLFCGGKEHQIQQGYKCGICGDPYDEVQPRTHEIGGPIYQAIMVANYTAGSVIDVDVLLTANHKGFFQFKLCPVPGLNTEATQECLDQTLLEVVGMGTTDYPIEPDYKQVHLQLKLPEQLTCDHCVFQWRYHAGNSWGVCEDGTQGVGCGPQEEFYGCADVTIHPALGTGSGGTATTSVLSSAGIRRTTPSRPAVQTSATTSTTSSTTTRRPGAQLCVGVPPFDTLPGIDAWCQLNCNHYSAFCPPSHCRCMSEEQAALRGKGGRRLFY